MAGSFTGSYTMAGLIYDYRCVWARDDTGFHWEATIGDADLISTTTGRIREASSECELLHTIAASVEREIERQPLKRVEPA